jgi:hypothetical protein
LIWLSAIDPAVQRYALAPIIQLASRVVGQ